MPLARKCSRPCQIKQKVVEGGGPGHPISDRHHARTLRERTTRVEPLDPSPCSTPFQRVAKAFRIICCVFGTAKEVDAVGIPPLADDDPCISQCFLNRLVADVHVHLLLFNDVINVQARSRAGSFKGRLRPARLEQAGRKAWLFANAEPIREQERGLGGTVPDLGEFFEDRFCCPGRGSVQYLLIAAWGSPYKRGTLTGQQN